MNKVQMFVANILRFVDYDYTTKSTMKLQ